MPFTHQIPLYSQFMFMTYIIWNERQNQLLLFDVVIVQYHSCVIMSGGSVVPHNM